MKRTIALIFTLTVCAFGLYADNDTKDARKNSAADNILGDYFIEDEDGTTAAKFFKAEDGTYFCQTFGEKAAYDKNGKMRLDEYNPDPRFRSYPLHKAVIVSGLSYNPEKKQWDGGTIHHPLRRLMRANCTADFVNGGKTLRVKGSVAGIGKSVYWKVVEKSK